MSAATALPSFRAQANALLTVRDTADASKAISVAS